MSYVSPVERNAVLWCERYDRVPLTVAVPVRLRQTHPGFWANPAEVVLPPVTTEPSIFSVYFAIRFEDGSTLRAPAARPVKLGERIGFHPSKLVFAEAGYEHMGGPH